MALLAPVVVIVILLGGGRSEPPRAAVDRAQPPRVTARAQARVVLQKAVTREDVARRVFDALKADEFDRMRSVLPNARDVEWLLGVLEEHAPEAAAKAEAEIQEKGGPEGLLAETIEKSRASFRQALEDAVAVIDWETASFGGVDEEGTTTRTEHGVEVCDLVFRVRDGDAVERIRLRTCMKVGRGWITNGRIAAPYGDQDDVGTRGLKHAQALTQLRNFEQAILMYRLTREKLPAALGDLTAGADAVMSSIPDDPWGKPYEYRVLGERKFEIASAGPDGAFGTEDDIVVER